MKKKNIKEMSTFEIKMSFFNCANDKEQTKFIVDLFFNLKGPITYAITKARNKFNSIPIEKEDLETISWIAFQESFIKYVQSDIKKKFISFVIDSIFWKCMDYCLKYTNNKHKVLNLSNHQFSDLDQIFNHHNDPFKIETQIILEDYFKNEQENFEIFLDYIFGTSKKDISSKYEISSKKLNDFIHKSIQDLSILFA